MKMQPSFYLSQTLKPLSLPKPLLILFEDIALKGYDV